MTRRVSVKRLYSHIDGIDSKIRSLKADRQRLIRLIHNATKNRARTSDKDSRRLMKKCAHRLRRDNRKHDAAWLDFYRCLDCPYYELR